MCFHNKLSRNSDSEIRTPFTETSFNHNDNEAKFDELLDCFNTTDPNEARKRKRGISDNEYFLIKLNNKLRDEMPSLLYPHYTPHDYSIYDPNVNLFINLSK